MGGDFNVVFENQDKKGGLGRLKTRVLAELLSLMEYFEINDIWRIKHPEKCQYTWKQKSPLIQCRLDFFLISSSLIDYVKESSIIPSIRSDHSSIALSFHNIDSNQRGKGYWKFNSRLLLDETYTNQLKEKITEWKSELNGNPKVKWEFLKYQIKNFTIDFSKSKSKQEKIHETNLLNKLKQLESNLTENNLEEYEMVKAELVAIDNEKTETLIFKSKVRWHEHGEKSSKYFLNLEKRNNARKSVNKLIDDKGNIITNQKDIQKEQKDFYKKLYYRKGDTNDNYYNDFLRNDLPTLDDSQKHFLDKIISVEECKKAMETFQKNKSPGNDGLTVEFYTFFWDNIKDILISCFNEIHKDGKMSNSHRQAVITLIDKKGKDRQYLKNWRPISLLNVDYKIISKVLAVRLQDILPSIIHENQTGFVKGRYIGDNIRALLDIMEITKNKNLPGILLGVDLEKAFDSVDWKFLHAVLEKFNFGPYFRKWVSIFYTDIEACIMNNGHSSGYFNLERGVRQGDPLSPYLFIIAIETFAHAVRCNNNIKGISLENTEIKLIQFADDTAATVKDKDSVKVFFDLLSKFELCSGLKVNREKTEAMWIGACRNSGLKPFGFTWKKCIKVLGIYLSYDEKEMIDKNYKEKVQDTKNNIALWKCRNLSFIGKNLIIKSLLLSKFTYVASLIPIPDEIIKEVDYLIQTFVWNGKRAKIKKNILMNSYENGGQNFPDFQSLVSVLKLKWIKRYVDRSVNHPWKTLANSYFIEHGGLDFLLYCNFDIHFLNINVPPFYKELLTLWSKIGRKNPDIIWNNRDIIENGNSFFLKDFFDAGIWYFRDFFDENNKLRGFNFFTSIGVKSVHFIKYCAIANHLKRLSNTTILNYDTTNIKELCVQYNRHTLPLIKLTIKMAYSIMIENKLQWQTRIREFYGDLYNINAEEWRGFFLNYRKSTISNHLKDFQYKILNGYLALNPLLQKMHVKDSSKCSFCHQEKETIAHIFFTCKYTKIILESFDIWIAVSGINGFNISEKNIIFGVNTGVSNKDLLNMLLIFLKYYIYRCRFDDKIPNFEGYLEYVRWNFLIEKKIAENTFKLEQHARKWKDIEEYV